MDVVAADVLKSFGYVALALDSLGDLDTCANGNDAAVAEALMLTRRSTGSQAKALSIRTYRNPRLFDGR